MEALECIKTRRSVRKFKEESITDAGVAGKAAEGSSKKIPEFRIGGNIHKSLDDEL